MNEDEIVVQEPEVPAEWRHCYSADCAPVRFDVPHHPGDYVMVRPLNAAQDEQIQSAGLRFTENAARIDTLKTYLAACAACVTEFQIEGRRFGKMEDNERAFRELTLTLRDWIKARMAEVNPSLGWAPRPFETASTSGSGEA